MNFAVFSTKPCTEITEVPIAPSPPQISARNTHRVLDTLKKQQSPKQRADQEAKGNAPLVSSAVRSRGGILLCCIHAFLFHIFCWICPGTGLAGHNSHPDLEAGTGRAELALPGRCYLEVAPLTTTDLILKSQTQQEN